MPTYNEQYLDRTFCYYIPMKIIICSDCQIKLSQSSHEWIKGDWILHFLYDFATAKQNICWILLRYTFNNF